jgi:hypothetical protein
MNANWFRSFGVLTLLLDVGLLIIVIPEAVDNRLGPQLSEKMLVVFI